MWTGSCRSDLKQSNSNTTKTQHQNDLCVASFQAWCYGLIVQFSSLEIVCKSGKQSLFLKAKYKQQHRDTRSFCVIFFVLFYPYTGYPVNGVYVLAYLLNWNTGILKQKYFFTVLQA